MYLWEQMKNKLDTKVDKEEGKGLSKNDFTDARKDRLESIATATCNTAQGTSAKTVNCPGFHLQDGARIMVTFAYGNSSNYITLNVNGTGAYFVWFPVGSSRAYNDVQISKYIVAGCAYEFIYQDGATPKWVYCGIAGGAADTAKKLLQGRRLQLSGMIESNGNSFDGSQDITMATKFRGLEFGGQTGWYKIAVVSGLNVSDTQQNMRIVLKINRMDLAYGGSGILVASCWVDEIGCMTDYGLCWEYMNEINPDHFKFSYSDNPFGDIEIWAYTNGDVYHATVLSEGGCYTEYPIWTLSNLAAGDPPDSEELPEGRNYLSSTFLTIENPATALKWKTPCNINGMRIDGTTNRMNYGVCNTSSSTIAKTVSCKGFQLIEGAEITVNFKYGNTANGATLNINNTGAKAIWHRNAPIGRIEQGEVLAFRYDGIRWKMVGSLNSAQTGAISESYWTMARQDRIDLNYYCILQKENQNFLPLKDTNLYSFEISDPHLNDFCVTPVVTGASIIRGFSYSIPSVDKNWIIYIHQERDSDGEEGIALSLPGSGNVTWPWDYNTEKTIEVKVHVIHC